MIGNQYSEAKAEMEGIRAEFAARQKKRIDEAYAWIANNPFPVPTAGEDRESFMARMSEWEFHASMAHEAIHDDKHDRRCFNERV